MNPDRAEAVVPQLLGYAAFDVQEVQVDSQGHTGSGEEGWVQPEAPAQGPCAFIALAPFPAGLGLTQAMNVSSAAFFPSTPCPSHPAAGSQATAALSTA